MGLDGPGIFSECSQGEFEVSVQGSEPGALCPSGEGFVCRAAPSSQTQSRGMQHSRGWGEWNLFGVELVRNFEVF